MQKPRSGQRPEGRGHAAARKPGEPASRHDAGHGGKSAGASAHRPKGGKPRADASGSDAPRSGRPRSDKPPSGKPGPGKPRDSAAGSARAFRGGPRPVAVDAPSGLAEPMRIAKAMARAGLCSRREAERWIEEGRVAVNGKTLASPALDVKPGDRILVDGQPLPGAEPARLWRYHKPKGLVTTHRDPEGRPTVFDAMPEHLPRVISIGRLDFNTEGLLLLTNDGELARYLELPETGWLRRYRVRAFGRVTQADLDALKDGITIEGVRYGPIEATLDSTQGANVWLTLGLREGKNREVKKILAHLGLEVNRLIRVSFGPFQLLELTPGAVEPVKRRVLAEQLGVKLAVKFGLSEGKEERKERHRRGARAAAGAEDGDEE